MVPERRRKKSFVVRGGPERRVHDWYWPGEAPSPVRHILVSWRGRSLVPVGFSPYPTPCNTDGPVGSARRPLSRIGFHDVQGW